MRRLTLFAATVALLCSTMAASAMAAAGAQTQAQASTQAQAGTQSQASTDGRYQWHNGRWWYYTPQGQWMYHDGARWNAYQPSVANNYRGANRFRRFSFNRRGRSYYSAGPGLAPMTGLNKSYSQPVEAFRKADSKAMETNDY
jgi:hypothetical protein